MLIQSKRQSITLSELKDENGNAFYRIKRLFLKCGPILFSCILHYNNLKKQTKTKNLVDIIHAKSKIVEKRPT